MRFATATSPQPRSATLASMTMLARVTAQGPSPMRGCQKSVTPGDSNPSPAAVTSALIAALPRSGPGAPPARAGSQPAVPCVDGVEGEPGPEDQAHREQETR